MLIAVAITGVLYEFHKPPKEAEKILKVEHLIVYIWSFVFLFGDFIMLFLRADTKNYSYSCIDYILMGYVIVPAVIISIEIFRSAKEYFNISNNNSNINKIAIGNATNV